MRWNRKQLREHTEKETAALQKQNDENIVKWADDVKRRESFYRERYQVVKKVALFVGFMVGFVVTAIVHGSFVSYKLKTPEGTEQLKNWLVFQEK